MLLVILYLFILTTVSSVKFIEQKECLVAGDGDGIIYVYSYDTDEKVTSIEAHEGNIHYRTPVVCRVSETFGKIHKTLGKWFAECNTRWTALAKKSDGKANFAECPTLGKVGTDKNPKK